MEENTEIGPVKSAVILGAGNVAWHLSHSLSSIGVKITQVYNRTPEKGRILAESVGAGFTDRIDDIDRNAGLTILSISDDAISDVAASLGFLRSGVLVHTAGSVPMEVLSAHAANYGVIYPLMTFTKDRTLNFSRIPVLLEGNNNDVYEVLRSLSLKLSDQVYEVSSPHRMMIHIAAVISSNFSNHLLWLSEKILNDAGLPLNLLKPLMDETISKAVEMGPDKAQTGPAIRGNIKVLEKHLQMLEKYPDIRDIYNIMSAGISTRRTGRNG